MQYAVREVEFRFLTATKEIKVGEKYDTEHEEHKSERKQKAQGRKPKDKEGKILDETESL